MHLITLMILLIEVPCTPELCTISLGSLIVIPGCG